MNTAGLLPELYVYYRVDAAQAEAALRAFDQAGLGFNGPRLLRREHESPGQQTWMEIHCGAQAQESEAKLAALLAPYISGARHIERFLPLRPAHSPQVKAP
ncbi:DUF4936 family protein [Roseateles oligotrophus]|uniref:DUF4936 family protein n=1 Tax=Roseateles oligotrophus TaxID=1769250 RepID=A0ABT2YFX8_9BURK|nr:DUF4936 family protein [Roseateles oligotrophus]MCV2368955.1 DUF4936 family protein [Roseateles oligotrophus]